MNGDVVFGLKGLEKNNEPDIQIRGGADISVKTTYRRYL